MGHRPGWRPAARGRVPIGFGARNTSDHADQITIWEEQCESAWGGVDIHYRWWIY